MKRDYHIIWHRTIDSTNSEAARHISDIDNLSVIAAVEQTAGRGQRGNRWTADAGENLTFSVVIRPGSDGIPQVAASVQFVISEIAALAVSGYLETKGIGSKIKWPNDIYCSDRKICGILIENCISDGLLKWSIVGTGINLAQTVFPSDVPNPTSVKLETGMEFLPESELPIYLEKLDALLDILALPDGEAIIRRMYLERMYRRGERHLYSSAKDGLFYAEITGIAADGCLEVKTDDGRTGEFAFKEIKYVIDEWVTP